MGKIGARLPNFCLNRIRPHVRVRSPPIQSKLGSNISNVGDPSKNDRKCEECYGTARENHDDHQTKKTEDCGDEVKRGLVIGRKIMIVVDSSNEAKGALLWSLSHTVQTQDKVILLHVIKPSKQASSEEFSRERTPNAHKLAHSFKNMCKARRPELQCEVAVVNGKEKGPTIVEEARKRGVSLLVLGQKKRSTTWRLVMMWAGNHRAATGPGCVVDYCIQNADCMAVAVRRKNKKQGGYLITTKRHTDFWLLA